MIENQKSLGVNNFNIIFAASILIAALICIFFCLRHYESHLTDPNSPAAYVGPTDDQRQQLNFESGALFRETKSTQLRDLNSYEWADQQHHFAKLPLERAQDIYLKNLKSFGGGSK